ncbi:GlxA family transcriptional regulator [Spiribacter halobius]|uniref:AraC family transcriptional regulator n=1 Tax=Sediminicurvatus halobius TaxID=2182432 RepID=A0A2U2MWP4_9GAMM|nr:helix-turn-helix domain-containing protein [Spiribacter halobius]PWG61226.1 AraC family transcriptional regulator [Spiribacter halobius]UEX79197.1 helix-turn-helix domain-containing protein [Spiribacter halobius]
MLDVTVVLVDNGMPTTAIAPLEVFGTAGVLWNRMRGRRTQPRYRVRTASQDGRTVRTAAGVGLAPDCSIGDIDHADIVIVSAVGVDLEADCPAHAALYPWLRNWHDRGATVAGVCAGAALVAEAGLLDGRPATTHWGVADACRRRYPQVRWQPERIITESGNLLCSGGVYAGVDLSLYLVEKHCGHRVAVETAKALLLQTPRYWQMGYDMEPPEAAHSDQRIYRVQEWLFRHFAEPVRVNDLARRAGMSPSNFARRFKAVTGESPLNYLHQLRINASRHLLENDLQSIQEIANAVGYEDVTHFRRVFKRRTGAVPQAYRERFGISDANQVALTGRTPHR